MVVRVQRAVVERKVKETKTKSSIRDVILLPAAVNALKDQKQYSFVGGGFRIVQDVPPFILAAEEPLMYKGINRVGLRRKGFTREEMTRIKQAYRIYFRSDLPRLQALDQMANQFGDDPHVQSILKFISASERGII